MVCASPFRFNSLSEYRGVVRDIKEGKLRDVKVKGQTYRAVALERTFVDRGRDCRSTHTTVVGNITVNT